MRMMNKSCVTCAFYKPFDVPAVNESYGIWGKCLYGVPEGGTGYNVYIPHGCCKRYSEKEGTKDGKTDPSGG